MNVRHIHLEEYGEADRIKHIAFGRKMQTPKNDADDPDAIYNSIVGCFDDHDILTARARNIDYRCMFDGHEVFMTGLSGVASLPQARGLGRVRAIIKYLFEEDRARGALFSTLFPFSHAYYRRFGYALSSERTTLHIKTRLLSSFSSQSYSARMHRLDDGFADIRLITNRMSARYNLAMRPSDRQYKKACGGDAVQHGDYRFILYDTQNAPCAWLYYTDHEDESGKCTARVHMLEYTDTPALLCALGFLYGLRARYASVELHLPHNENILYLLNQPNDATCTATPYGMARILNVQAVLELMRHPKSAGSYVLHVMDEMLPDNDGVYTVSYIHGKSHVTRTPQCTPDLRLNIGMLTQLALGYVGLEQAYVQPEIEVLSNKAVLHNVFVRKPTLLSYHF